MPQAYAYLAEMRSTRDLLRRRMHLMRQRAELLGHVQLTNQQYNMPEIGRKIAYRNNGDGVAERFAGGGNEELLLTMKTLESIGLNVPALFPTDWSPTESTFFSRSQSPTATIFGCSRFPAIGNRSSFWLHRSTSCTATFRPTGAWWRTAPMKRSGNMRCMFEPCRFRT